MKNRQLMEDAIRTDNKLLIAKLKLEEGWTDDEVESLQFNFWDEMIEDMRDNNELMSLSDLINYVEKED